jgi:hypothetical protein
LWYNNRPLTAAEVQAHPEFPYITWDLKPQSKGTLPVAKNRGGPLDIAWEVHGEGENKMVVSYLCSLITVYLLVFNSVSVVKRGGSQKLGTMLCSIS